MDDLNKFPKEKEDRSKLGYGHYKPEFCEENFDFLVEHVKELTSELERVRAKVDEICYFLNKE
jgi:hypothetical protein